MSAASSDAMRPSDEKKLTVHAAESDSKMANSSFSSEISEMSVVADPDVIIKKEPRVKQELVYMEFEVIDISGEDSDEKDVYVKMEVRDHHVQEISECWVEDEQEAILAQQVKTKEGQNEDIAPLAVSNIDAKIEQPKKVEAQVVKTAETKTTTGSPNVEDFSVNNDESNMVTSEKAAENDSLIITADDVDLENEVQLICDSHKEVIDKLSSKDKMNSSSDIKKTKVKTNVDDTKTRSDKKQKSKQSTDVEKVVQKKELAKKPNESSKHSNRSFWLSNISATVKAAELKQHFSTYGKVVTAKVVTDGKSYYGYLIFENQEVAQRSFRKFDRTVFGDRVISMSSTRPVSNPESVKSSDKESVREKDLDKAKPDHKQDRKSRKRVSDKDPLTTKFITKSSRVSSPRASVKSRRSSSSTRNLERDYLREKKETERLKKQILEHQELSRQERIRQRQKEEEQRELEWKLKMQRKQLQIEREMFEKERKEVIRLDQERRRIEEEKLDMLRQKAKLEEELREMRKIDLKKRKEVDNLMQKDDAKRQKLTVQSKLSDASYKHKIEEDRYNSSYRKAKPKENNSYLRPPPPPKLSDTAKIKVVRGFEFNTRRRDEEAMRKPYGERKVEQTDFRKIETIHHDRRSDYLGRKDRIDSRLTRDCRSGHGFASDGWKATPVPVGKPKEQWLTPVQPSETWKVGVQQTAARYEQQSIQSSSYGTPRYDANYYYNPPPPGADYTRYDQYSQMSRKY